MIKANGYGIVSPLPILNCVYRTRAAAKTRHAAVGSHVKRSWLEAADLAGVDEAPADEPEAEAEPAAEEVAGTVDEAIGETVDTTPLLIVIGTVVLVWDVTS